MDILRLPSRLKPSNRPTGNLSAADTATPQEKSPM